MLNLLRGLLGLKASAPKVKPTKPEPMSLDELRQRLLDEERPSLWLRPTDQPAFSKLGGLPDLEASFEWPSTPHGDPMAFVAQIDLAQARAAGGPDWLPDVGALYFFAIPNGIWDGEGGRVIYRAGVPEGPHPGLPFLPAFPERRVGMTAHPSYPETDWLNITERTYDIEEDELATVEYLRPGQEGDWGDHRFCGYPAPVQGGHLALECELLARGQADHGKSSFRESLYKDPVAFEALNKEATAQWRMLLQVASEDELKMDWVSSGRIWYFIREADARAQDFSQVQFYCQFT